MSNRDALVAYLDAAPRSDAKLRAECQADVLDQCIAAMGTPAKASAEQQPAEITFQMSDDASAVKEQLEAIYKNAFADGYRAAMKHCVETVVVSAPRLLAAGRLGGGVTEKRAVRDADGTLVGIVER
jgi:hypothetical protein